MGSGGFQRVARGLVSIAEITCNCFVINVTRVHVQAVGQVFVAAQRFSPTVLRQVLRKWQVTLVNANVEVRGTAPGMLVTQ